MGIGEKKDKQKANKALTTKLLFAVMAMFGFGYALVPLYDVMCDALGINGKTNKVAIDQPHGMVIDLSRTIDVELMAHIPSGMLWQMKPKVRTLQVHPGQVIQTAYLAKNLSQQDTIVQAVPSISPGIAATHFNKMECFCFTRQPLKAGESTELGLVFYIEPDIPDSIHTLTLSYTVFDITDSVEQEPKSVAMLTNSTATPRRSE
ncbi:cytochrome c oxidase assembly protein [Vibrio sp. DW001]|uniref:cytochrome c oxidase assembly protein n=1 Tax=Vibrio sp. DW001 TaxID=2912315 RepID=UPI0023AF29EE|nr:cytochrome c oxidase assembly protein [Vibrio sp. DW001]WED29684.1 cytochrome c oxidase assembly protein [Vibrio sp. DW001]